ncbi:VanZ family protein [Thermodesulfobacteriota bacterium]
MNNINENQAHSSVTKLLLLLFSLFVVYGTVIPFNFVDSRQEIIYKISRIQWIPFLDTSDNSLSSIPDIVQNIFFFVPFGFLGFWLKTRDEKGVLTRCVKISLLAFALSLSVETLQIFCKDRYAGTTDLVTNTAGAFAGFWLAYIISQIFIKIASLTQVKKYLTLRAAYPFLVALIMVIINEWQPFDFSLDVSAVWPKIKGLIREPFIVSLVFRDELVIYFHFFLFSYVFTILLRNIGTTRYIIKAMVISIGVGLFLELSQIIIGSRVPGFQDVLTITAGCTCGGLFAGKVNFKGSAFFWSLLTFIITFISAGVRMLNPFHTVSAYRGFNWVPFLGYYERTTFIALSNFIEIMLIYFPMGFIIKFLYPQKESIFFLIVLIALGISFPLEYFQGWIEGRYSDITDVIGALVGALAGAWVFSEGWPRYQQFIKVSFQRSSV